MYNTLEEGIEDTVSKGSNYLKSISPAYIEKTFQYPVGRSSYPRYVSVLIHTPESIFHPKHPLYAAAFCVLTNSVAGSR